MLYENHVTIHSFICQFFNLNDVDFDVIRETHAPLGTFTFDVRVKAKFKGRSC
jgi:hypothetical protein